MVHCLQVLGSNTTVPTPYFYSNSSVTIFGLILGRSMHNRDVWCVWDGLIHTITPTCSLYDKGKTCLNKGKPSSSSSHRYSKSPVKSAHMGQVVVEPQVVPTACTLRWCLIRSHCLGNWHDAILQTLSTILLWSRHPHHPSNNHPRHFLSFNNFHICMMTRHIQALGQDKKNYKILGHPMSISSIMLGQCFVLCTLDGDIGSC